MWKSGLASSVLVLALTVSGCSGGAASQPEWSAKAEVQANRAIITVAVPGKKMNKDYHPHLNLDGGPEVMMYGASYTFSELKQGNHQVRVIIADPQHKPMPGMEKTLQVSVN